MFRSYADYGSPDGSGTGSTHKYPPRGQRYVFRLGADLSEILPSFLAWFFQFDLMRIPAIMKLKFPHAGSRSPAAVTPLAPTIFEIQIASCGAPPSLGIGRASWPTVVLRAFLIWHPKTCAQPRGTAMRSGFATGPDCARRRPCPNLSAARSGQRQPGSRNDACNGRHGIT